MSNKQSKQRDETVDLAQVRDASSLLLLSPEMEDSASDICHELLGVQSSNDIGIIKVSYHFSPMEIADRWIRKQHELTGELVCLSVSDLANQSLEAYPENFSFETVRADDLTGIGMKLNQIVGRLDVQTSEIRVCLDSLDSMVMYNDQSTVYRFVRTISNFLGNNNAKIHFHVDPKQNEELVGTLKSAVNGVVEVDESGLVDVKVR